MNVTSSVTIGTVVRDLGSFGLSLTDSDIQDLITANMAAGTLPGDPADVYFVLTGPSVGVTGFCSQGCGYHSQFLLGSTRIVYGHVGNPRSRCPSTCEVRALLSFPLFPRRSVRMVRGLTALLHSTFCSWSP